MNETLISKEKLKTVVIIPAAGKGVRMGTGNKLLLPLNGRPILQRTIEAFQDCPLVTAIVLAVSDDTEQFCREYIIDTPAFTKVAQLIPGGPTRQASVYNALKKVAPEFDIVLVHDGARPLVGRALIETAINDAARHGAVVPAVELKDTIKEISGELITKTPERASLRAVQTPQAFRADLLINAFESAISAGFTGTDEASLIERAGIPVKIFIGSYENIKITTHEDMLIARSILQKREKAN